MIANNPSEMIGVGCNNVSEVNSLPVILLKYGINKTLTPNARTAEKKVIIVDSPMN